jgi:hypothetical protein
MIFGLLVGLVSLVLALFQLLAAFDIVRVPDGAASPFLPSTNPRAAKVAMAAWMVLIGIAALVGTALL